MTSPPAPAPSRVPIPVLDCTPLLSGAVLEEHAAIGLASVLRVLGDPARLRLLSVIQSQPTHEACVCHLTGALGLTQPTVSHHLRVLYEAGLIDRERRGNWVYYRTVAGALNGVVQALGASPAVELAEQTSAASAACGCP